MKKSNSCFVVRRGGRRMHEKTLVKWGGLGVIVASACCWLPLLLIFLGVINISTALAIGYRATYFLVAGLTLTVIAIYFYWNKGVKSCCVTKTQYKKYLLFTILILLLVLGLTYLIKQILLPYLAPIIYEQYYNRLNP